MPEQESAQANVCEGPACPLCTAQGFGLFVLGVFLIISGKEVLRLAGLACILMAYVLPYILKKNKKPVKAGERKK